MRSSFIVQTYAGDQVTPSLENTRARCQKERLQPCLQCIGVVASLGLSIVISFFVGTVDWVIHSAHIGLGRHDSDRIATRTF